MSITAAMNALFLICCSVLCLYVIKVTGDDGAASCPTAAAACITEKRCADAELLNHILSHNSDHSCIISQIQSTTPCVFSSSLVVRHQDAIPNSQAWARCQSCFWHGDHFQTISIRDGDDDDDAGNAGGAQGFADYSSYSSSSGFTDISWSYWGEFFYLVGHNDRLKAQTLSFTTEDLLSIKLNRELFQDITYVIDRPVFYIPVIALHYGHFLIDVLQQVYGVMMEAYGEVRQDALLLLDTGNPDQREDLQDLLDMFGLTYHEGDSTYDGPYSVLLRWLTTAPVMSVPHFLKNRRFLFTDIHLGSDLKHSFFSSGTMRQPCHFMSSDRHVQQLTTKYKLFRDHLWRQYLPAEWLALSDEEKMFSSSSPAEWDVLFIQRGKSRMILNLQDLADKTQELSLRYEAIDLDLMPFVDQLAYWHFTACVVAVAGTAAHNMLFMRPGSTMVIIMQAEWCEWSWMYVNQGILLGITVHVLCDRREERGGLYPSIRTRHSSFVNKFWLQGANDQSSPVLAYC